MEHKLTFKRVKTERLDGWDVTHDGLTLHDCSLGCLIRNCLELDWIKQGDSVLIVREDGTTSTRTFN